jgi:hypothetical protein
LGRLHFPAQNVDDTAKEQCFCQAEGMGELPHQGECLAALV